MNRVLTQEDLARIRLRLLREATLFEDPQAYAAGVEDAIGALLVEAGHEAETPPAVVARAI
jgi:hypothetical protein